MAGRHALCGHGRYHASARVRADSGLVSQWADLRVRPVELRYALRVDREHRWIEGDPATIWRVPDQTQFAADLSDFLTALYQVDSSGGPPPGEHNFFRGGPLAVYDSETRAALAALDGQIDTSRAAWPGHSSPATAGGCSRPGSRWTRRPGRSSRKCSPRMTVPRTARLLPGVLPDKFCQISSWSRCWRPECQCHALASNVSASEMT